MCYAKNFTFGEKRQMRENLYSGIVDLIAPGEISKKFKVVTINEKRGSISILFEEKANLIPEGLKEKDAVRDRTGWVPKSCRSPDISVKGQDGIFIHKT